LAAGRNPKHETLNPKQIQMGEMKKIGNEEKRNLPGYAGQELTTLV
jgi:hypothetical protein